MMMPIMMLIWHAQGTWRWGVPTSQSSC
jgi:hypothetical protein